jgi:hypothetical protein
MGASDLINAAEKYLASRGRPHMANVKAREVVRQALAFYLPLTNYR